MQLMLSLMIGLSIAMGASPSCASQHEKQILASASPDMSVYDGAEADMPSDKGYLFAMKLDRRRPTTYGDAVKLVAGSLPEWMRIALATSKDNHECGVYVNDRDYFWHAVNVYFWIWHVDESPTHFLRKGTPDVEFANSTFAERVCRYVKNDIQKGRSE